jgi:hypothetical protein
MCQKRQRRCDEIQALREAALQEWSKAETLPEARAAWARLGGFVTLHRYGRLFYVLLSRHAHGDREAYGLLCAHMQKRREVAR